MKEKLDLNDFEKEYFSEIQSKNVSIYDLKRVGVSEKTLLSEKYLFDCYGDEIFKASSNDEILGQKRVVKLSDEEKNSSSELDRILEIIDDDKFDEKLESILRKVSE